MIGNSINIDKTDNYQSPQINVAGLNMLIGSPPQYRYKQTTRKKPPNIQKDHILSQKVLNNINMERTIAG